MQDLRDDLGGRIEEGHAAGFQLGQVLRLEHQVPGVHRRIVAEHGPDLVEVVGDAVGAPHVGHHVVVARVLALQHLEQGGVEVLPVRQLALVQRLEHPGLQVVGQEAVAGHHQVIARMAGQQLGLQYLVAVVDVVLRRDAGLRLEVLQGVRADVVEPVVDAHFRRGAGPAPAVTRAAAASRPRSAVFLFMSFPSWMRSHSDHYKQRAASHKKQSGGNPSARSFLLSGPRLRSPAARSPR